MNVKDQVPLLVRSSGGVRTISLNRPARLNALTQELKDSLRSEMLNAANDTSVRVIVLTGSGRGFCAGADMDFLGSLANTKETFKEQVLLEGLEARSAFLTEHSYFPAISKPIIAAINGPTAGLGLVLACYCDIRLASSAATFSASYSLRGLIAEYGSSWILPRLIGVGAAMDLLVSGRRIGSEEALRMGLVSAVYDDTEFENRVANYAGNIATMASPRATSRIKYQVYEAFFQDIGEAIELSEKELAEALKSEDFREGVAHFKEKRAAKFIGK
jgi:enoyl-CoA hydratase/carnithine racemase